MTVKSISEAETLIRPFGQAIAATPARLAPEREPELAALAGNPAWELLFLDGATNFKAVPVVGSGSPEIHASYRTLLGLWCVAKGAVLITDAVSAALAKGEKTIQSDPGSPYHTATRYFSLCRDMTKGLLVTFASDMDLPDAVASADTRVNNLFYGMAGWTLLHEIGHIHLKHEIEGTPDLRRKQEFEADQFATRWILSGSGIPPDHYQFRIMVIATAMLWLGISNEADRDTASHPRVSQRLDRCREEMATNNDQIGLEMASYLFKVAFLPSDDLGEFDTAAAAFDEVLFSYSRFRGD